MLRPATLVSGRDREFAVLLHCQFNRRAGRVHIAGNLAFLLRLGKQSAVRARSGKVNLGQKVTAAADIEAHPATSLDSGAIFMSDQ